MAARRLLRWLATALVPLALCAAAHAQLEAGVENALSPAETARLREVLERPFDPSALNQMKSELHRQKDLAAFRLGDVVFQEKNAREWMQIEPVDGKWALMLTLSGTERKQEAFQLGKELLQQVRWPPSAVRLRSHLATSYMNDSNLKEASRLLNEAEALVQSDVKRLPLRGDTPFHVARAEMDFLTTKSRYLMRIGKWAEGIQASKMAVEKSKVLLQLAGTISVEAWRTYAQANATWAMGDLAWHQMAAGLYADAEWTLREAIKLARSMGFAENQLFGFYNRAADLYLATGQFKDALLFAQRSEQIVLSRGYRKGSPMWLFAKNRALMALAGQDQWPMAASLLDEMNQERVRADPTSTRSNIGQLQGYVYLKSQRAEPALRVLRSTLQWHVDNYGPAHYHTASVRGLYAMALWQNGQPAEARPEFDQSVKNLTAPESLSGDFVENAFQRKTKQFILQSYMQLLAGGAQANRQDAEILFQVADLLSTSSVQQALSDAAVRAGVTIPGLADIIRQEQDAKNEIATLTSYVTAQSAEDERRRNPQVVEQMRKRMRELEAARRGYKAEISKRFPEYFQLIQPRAPTPADIAKLIKPDELFVSIMPLEDKTCVWAIDAQGRVEFHVSALGDRQTHALVDQLRKTLDVAELGARAPAFDYAGSHRLYRELLAPFEAVMADKKHLIVAGSGALAKLPLAVLVRSSYAGRDPAQAPWLVRDLAVTYVPTANGWLSLKRLGQAAAGNQPLMAWGDPSFDPKAATSAAAPGAPQLASAAGGATVRSAATLRAGDLTARHVLDPETYVTYSKLSPLPETRDEVLKLARILDANPEQDVLLGAQATRQSVLRSSASGQLARKQVVVFATHGLLAGDLPNLNQPALAMASTSDAADSPLLTLEDVLSLKLNADWVVLSACNTAGADGRAGEALTGLARGFFFAGSRSLLVTHWSVESESATLLTTQTFAAYKKDPAVRRAEALRQAMLQTMKQPQFAHPAYWAPYALVGEGGR